MKWRLSALLSSPAAVTLLVLALVIIGATATYMALEGWDFLTAFIFTLATITTVGYGNVFPHTRGGELFTASLMFVALAAVAVTLSTYAARLIRLVARGANPMEENERAIASLQNHIVVAADPALGPLLVQGLRARGLPFLAMTRDDAQHARWIEEGVLTLLGDPDDEDLLLQAGIERAAGLIVALGSDADNVFVSLSAHDLNPRLRIVARAHAASSIPKLRRSGANEVILPDEVLALNLAGSFRDRDQIGQAVQHVTVELRDQLARAIGREPETAEPPRQMLFRALRLALQDLGPGMDDMLYALGRQFGRDAVAPNLAGDGLCDSMARLPVLWTSAGLGRIRVADCSESGAHVEEDECATCQGLPQVGRPVCHLERGVITGALEAKLGRTVRTRETKCWGLGNNACEFEITVDLDVHA
jgi:predicted hydrocarbon binding protein/voltage-gated potassium channel Kch